MAFLITVNKQETRENGYDLDLPVMPLSSTFLRQLLVCCTLDIIGVKPPPILSNIKYLQAISLRRLHNIADSASVVEGGPVMQFMARTISTTFDQLRS